MQSCTAHYTILQAFNSSKYARIERISVVFEAGIEVLKLIARGPGFPYGKIPSFLESRESEISDRERQSTDHSAYLQNLVFRK